LSIFKTSAIVLKIDKIGQKDFIYTLFTLDYWKIKANKKFSKTEKSLDIWYLINFEIETKGKKDIAKIRNIKIKWEFLSQKRNFSEINNFLTLISTILKKIADWIPVYEIFEIIKKIINYKPILEKTTTTNQEKINSDMEIKLILAKLKIIDICWELNIQNKNPTISKILKFINSSKIDKILLLNWISPQIKKELEKI
jgi:hypothetical protein